MLFHYCCKILFQSLSPHHFLLLLPFEHHLLLNLLLLLFLLENFCIHHLLSDASAFGASDVLIKLLFIIKLSESLFLPELLLLLLELLRLQLEEEGPLVLHDSEISYKMAVDI